MKRITSSILAIALCASLIKPAKATPAALAPIALCSTGIGCVLVGTAIVGGIIVYVWKRGDGKKIQSDAKGNVLSMIDDPDKDGEPGVFSARDARHCARIAGGRRYEWVGNGKCKIWG